MNLERKAGRKIYESKMTLFLGMRPYFVLLIYHRVECTPFTVTDHRKWLMVNG